jgi:hypothetical protein
MGKSAVSSPQGDTTVHGHGWSRAWHATLAVVVLVALVIQVTLVITGGTDVNSGRSTQHLDLGTRLLRLVSYFTIQSNLIVLVAAVSLALRPARDGRLWRVVRLDALLGIAITGIVYATVLANLMEHEGAAAWANAGLHYISPWLTLLGWLLFGPRPRIDRATVAWALAWPLTWIGYTFAHGALSGWYPYPFLDVTALGYAAALRNTAVVVLVALVLVALLKVADGRLGVVTRRRAASGAS